MDLLYTELSVFQYNLETLITGKTQEGNIISEQEEFDACHSKATDNLKNITTMLDDLVNGINK
jgi:hypothetical protein